MLILKKKRAGHGLFAICWLEEIAAIRRREGYIGILRVGCIGAREDYVRSHN